MSRRVRLVLSGLCVAVLALGGLTTTTVATASSSQHAASAQEAAIWLSGQLSTDGTFPNPDAPRPDQGLMIDALFAMHAAGRPDLAEPIVEALSRAGDSGVVGYWRIEAAGYSETIVGALAKSTLAIQVAGRDPRSFAGVDHVTALRDSIAGDGDQAGLLRGTIVNGDQTTHPLGNVFDHSLGIMALAAADELPTATIPAFLDTFQCDDGAWAMTKGNCASGGADGAAMALSALLTARDHGATGLDDAIEGTRDWLREHQHTAGGWGGGTGTTETNTNSTGLAVQALSHARGSRGAVDGGATYITTAQVTAERDADGPFAVHIGAIAYVPREYQDSRRGRELAGGTDRWVRATSQAVLGLAQVSFSDLIDGRLPTAPEPWPRPTPSTPTPDPTAPVPAAPGTGGDRTPHTPSDAAGQPAPHRDTPPDTRRAVAPADPTEIEDGSGSPAGRIAAYLAANLVDGDHIEVTDGDQTYVDYDATVQVVLALHAIGEQGEARDRAAAFVLDPASVEAYVHGRPYEEDEATYAEPLSKVILLELLQREIHGADDEHDRALESWQEQLGDLVDDGSVRDIGEFVSPDGATVPHAWTALALAASGDETAEPMTERLATAQCADGLFGTRLDGDCRKGELEISDVAAQAVNGVGLEDLVMTSASGSVVSARAALSTDRSSTVSALRTSIDQSAPDGVIRRGEEELDPRTTADVATTRLALGADVSLASVALSGVQREDGGVALAVDDEASDFFMSLETAPALAGRTWLQSPESPLRPAPVTVPEAPVTAAAPPAPWGVNPWAAAAMMLLTAAVAGYAGHGLRRQRDEDSAAT
ncbi:hypothetical protein JL108_16120 [Aeromicrobium sp. YIM 150415]|uniref:hypothetical protein n=1 Tax=Aeromicrobium sp. YIM 150415 TaxID=2803912 RepID=UPI001965D873|nr:hypothetical protein [Aeromicrobium sp. YIM 150415]MBM9464979.1 hypothetical protein [Aeromicrobium sp. YIM 150415]